MTSVQFTVGKLDAGMVCLYYINNGLFFLLHKEESEN